MPELGSASTDPPGMLYISCLMISQDCLISSSRTWYRARQSPLVAIGIWNSTGFAPCPSQLSAKQRYGSAFRMSRLTPEARARGPVSDYAVASSSEIIPTPSTRSMKMRFVLSNVSISPIAFAIRLSVKFVTISMNVFSHGKSFFRPPTRV